jgi:hypothetical protein
VKAAGLVDALKGNGPFTVFAPTDEAFAKLPAGTVDTLLKPENKEKLVAILTYHVVPGRLLSIRPRGGHQPYSRQPANAPRARHVVEASGISFGGEALLNIFDRLIVISGDSALHKALLLIFSGRMLWPPGSLTDLLPKPRGGRFKSWNVTGATISTIRADPPIAGLCDLDRSRPSRAHFSISSASKGQECSAPRSADFLF